MKLRTVTIMILTLAACFALLTACKKDKEEKAKEAPAKKELPATKGETAPVAGKPTPPTTPSAVPAKPDDMADENADDNEGDEGADDEGDDEKDEDETEDDGA